MTKVFYVGRKGSDMKKVATYPEADALRAKGYRITTMYRPLNEVYDNAHPEVKAYHEFMEKNYDREVDASGKVRYRKKAVEG